MSSLRVRGYRPEDELLTHTADDGLLAGKAETSAHDLFVPVVADRQLPSGNHIPVESVWRFPVVAKCHGHLPSCFAKWNPAKTSAHRRQCYDFNLVRGR